MNSSSFIYLDYAATTPVDPRVVLEMTKYLSFQGVFGNPASKHLLGQEANEALEKAREKVAALINASPREIIFTSGATESNNLAIKGLAEFYKKKGNHIITQKTEHKAVLDVCKYLENHGFELSYLSVDKSGKINLEELENNIKKETILISIMHVNNETGAIQNIEAIGAIARKYRVFFHSDCAQSNGKLKIDVQKMELDLISLASHKIYGPKGIGALYVRRYPRVRLIEQINGGGHEQGLRSGTLPTHQIVGMGKAFELAKNEREENQKKIKSLSELFWKNISNLPWVSLNVKDGLPNILNIRFQGIDNEILIKGLKDLYFSSGSACNSGAMEPSYVLQSMGLSNEEAHESVRFSFGICMKEEDIIKASDKIKTFILSIKKDT